MYKLNNKVSLKNETSIKMVLEYSDEPKKMETLLKTFEVSATLKGFAKMNDDSNETMKFEIEVRDRKKSITFDFYQSIFFSEEMNEPRNKKKKVELHNQFLYDILACMRSDSYIGEDLQDFCNNFGYEIDSLKTINLYSECVKQQKKIVSMFSYKELEYFPS